MVGQKEQEEWRSDGHQGERPECLVGHWKGFGFSLLVWLLLVFCFVGTGFHVAKVGPELTL